MLDHTKPWIELLITSAATLFAAYGGAKYAFSIQNKKNEERRKEEDIANGNLAIFTLIRYHNKFINIDRQMIGEMRDHPHRHHFIKPSFRVENSPPKFDYPSLYFLINSHPNLLGKFRHSNKISQAHLTLSNRDQKFILSSCSHLWSR